MLTALVTVLEKLADASQDWGESARDGSNADLQRRLASGNQSRLNPCESSFCAATWRVFQQAREALWQFSPRMANTLEGDYLVVVNNLRHLAKPTGDSERDGALWGPIFFAKTCRDFARVVQNTQAPAADEALQAVQTNQGKSPTTGASSSGKTESKEEPQEYILDDAEITILQELDERDAPIQLPELVTVTQIKPEAVQYRLRRLCERGFACHPTKNGKLTGGRMGVKITTKGHEYLVAHQEQ